MRWGKLPLDRLEPERIAIIKPSALGDIAHSLPVLSAIRSRFPQAHISWVVNRSYEPLLTGHPDLNDTIPFDRSALKRGIFASLSALRQFSQVLRQSRFDLVLDLQGLLRSGMMVWATGAARRVGLSSAREGARWFYTDVVTVPRDRPIHAVDRYWALVEALGAGHFPRQFILPRNESAEAWADSTLAEWPRPWIAMAPGSRWQTKRWLPGHFQALGQQVQERFGGTLFLVGGPEEKEATVAVARGLKKAHLDLAGQTTIPQLVSLLARMDLMIANDTGPLHVAVALGRPVVAPYTCTRIELTGPYGAGQGAVSTKVWCAGSLKKSCSRMECMRELLPERLWPSVEEALNRWCVQRHSA